MSWSIRSLALCVPLLLPRSAGPTPPRMGEQDRVRLAEAFATIAAVQEKAWPGWSAAPSSLVLVDRDFEYLLLSGELQYSDPAYWRESEALGLAGDDQTGMWMLNYSFPYASMSAAFASLSRDLARLVGGPAPARPAERVVFWGRYSAFCSRLKPEDYRYLSFQLWQEGIARYAETRVAEIAAREHRVSAEFAALHDYRTFAAAADSLRGETLDELRTQTMKEDGRTVFYAFGAALGLLLDQEGTPWRDRYLAEKFYLEKYRAPRRDPDAIPVSTNDAAGAARRWWCGAPNPRYRGMSYRLTFS